MALHAGEKLGPYEVMSLIGKGGMGEVYRAIDTRLQRDVAVKISAGQFTERFEREARAVAALNHPNICTLHDVGPNYLVMEHVDGAPVAPQSDIRKLLDLAVQIADGMAAAHTAGFVHRDLKPENILVNREGRVKILDFGLAQRTAAGTGQDELTKTRLTDPGSTVGTVAYMSPEQARGEQNLGPQSDQFSFGLVLYEMATGHSAFRRNSRAETMAAIIREEAEPLPATLPSPLRWIIERLLAKDSSDRYDSSRDLYRELRHIRERLSEATTVSQAVPPAGASKRRVPIAAVAFVALALGAALSWLLVPRPNPPDLSTYRFTIVSGEPAMEWAPAWSPDGKSIVYSVMARGLWHLRTRAIGSSQSTQLTVGEVEPVSPFWSPDGSRIYFNGQGGLWVVGAAAETPTGFSMALPALPPFTPTARRLPLSKTRSFG